MGGRPGQATRCTSRSINKVKRQIMSRSKPNPFLPPAARASDHPAVAPSLAKAGERDLIPGAASLVDPDGHRPDGLAIEVVSKLVPATPRPKLVSLCPVHVRYTSGTRALVWASYTCTRVSLVHVHSRGPRARGSDECTCTGHMTSTRVLVIWRAADVCVRVRASCDAAPASKFTNALAFRGIYMHAVLVR